MPSPAPYLRRQPARAARHIRDLGSGLWQASREPTPTNPTEGRDQGRVPSMRRAIWCSRPPASSEGMRNKGIDGQRSCGLHRQHQFYSSRRANRRTLASCLRTIQPVAVVLDLVNPVIALWCVARPRWDARRDKGQRERSAGATRGQFAVILAPVPQAGSWNRSAVGIAAARYDPEPCLLGRPEALT